jgi:hypothetical protein
MRYGFSDRSMHVESGAYASESVTGERQSSDIGLPWFRWYWSSVLLCKMLFAQCGKSLSTAHVHPWCIIGGPTLDPI